MEEKGKKKMIRTAANNTIKILILALILAVFTAFALPSTVSAASTPKAKAPVVKITKKARVYYSVSVNWGQKNAVLYRVEYRILVNNRTVDKGDLYGKAVYNTGYSDDFYRQGYDYKIQFRVKCKYSSGAHKGKWSRWSDWSGVIIKHL